MKLRAAVVLLAGALCAQTGPPAVNHDSVVIRDFEKRVAAYLQLRRGIESNLTRLKSTRSPEKISRHSEELRRAIREAREGSGPGDIFTPEISAEIRRLIAIAMLPDGRLIRQSLRSAEPVRLHLNINEKYPDDVPLQTTPPSLLENLPELPPEIEYRIAGGDLVLLDAKADLVVDLIRGVFS